MTTQRLFIRRGMPTRRVRQTRIDRVQNVNTEQSVLERVLRIGSVDFDTAGTDDSEFRIVGIASPGSVVAAVDRHREHRAGVHVQTSPTANLGHGRLLYAVVDAARAATRTATHTHDHVGGPANNYRSGRTTTSIWSKSRSAAL